LRARWAAQHPSGFEPQPIYSIRRDASEIKKSVLDPLQNHALDAEEVTVGHARNLRSQKRTPRGARPFWRRLKTSFEQHAAHSVAKTGMPGAFEFAQQ
jgi:hypothetical protein